MRLFDKLASSGPLSIRDIFKNSGGKIVVLQVDEIAKHYYQNDQMEWGGDDYPYAMSPWDSCFVEWKEPDWFNLPGGRTKNENPSEVGMFLNKIPREMFPETLRRIESMPRGKTPQMTPDQVASEIKEIAVLSCFSSTRGSPVDFEINVFWLQSPEGRILGTALVGNGLPKLLGSIGEYETDKLLRTFTHIAGLAFTFANCSNVKLDDITEQEQPAAKIRRRLKLPEVKRYTLNIAGHSTSPRREGYGDPQNGIMPFHLCRGHFATYTADRPMFGNPKLVGRYWHPPHTRGKKDRGEIIKDYAISEN